MEELVKQASAAGLDPFHAWDRTPGELLEYIEAFKTRMQYASYWGYNLALGIASMVLSSKKPEPWEVFPGWIPKKEMSDEEIAANLLAWCV